MNDADLEMLELEEAGEMGHAGICTLCGDILDPHHPKWAGQLTLRSADGVVRHVTPDEYAEGIGPAHPQLPWHVWCMQDRGIPA